MVHRGKTYVEFFARTVYSGFESVVQDYKPDIVIVFSIATFTGVMAALKKSRYGYRLIMADSHLPSEFSGGNQVLKNLMYALFRLFFAKLISNRADKIIAQQDDTKTIISQVYGITKPAYLIDNGTDTDSFRPDAQLATQLRKQLNIPKNGFVLVYTGKIIEQKGVDLLCEAFANLAEKYQDTWCCIVGSGPTQYVQRCQALLPKTVQKRCLWVGFQKQGKLPAYYSLADVAVWPLQETLSMNDAAACGIPFIANDQVGTTTRLSNQNALLYKKGDSSDLFTKIEWLYKHPKSRLQMGKLGRTLAVEKLSWSRVSKEYLS